MIYAFYDLFLRHHLTKKPMKKLNLFVMILFMTIAMLGGKELPSMLLPQGGIPIELTEILQVPLPGPKSVGQLPIQAWYIHKPCMISLLISDSQGPMMVTVNDASNHEILQTSVDGNQTVATIPLPDLQSGRYSITIQNSTYLLRGTFDVS